MSRDFNQVCPACGYQCMTVEQCHRAQQNNAEDASARKDEAPDTSQACLTSSAPIMGTAPVETSAGELTAAVVVPATQQPVQGEPAAFTKAHDEMLDGWGISDQADKPIWEQMVEISNAVPKEVWDGLSCTHTDQPVGWSPRQVAIKMLMKMRPTVRQEAIEDFLDSKGAWGKGGNAAYMHISPDEIIRAAKFLLSCIPKREYVNSELAKALAANDALLRDIRHRDARWHDDELVRRVLDENAALLKRCDIARKS